MKINRFMGHIDAMARQNRFEIQIFGPMELRSRGMRISKATVPGRKFTTESYSEIPGGPARKYLQKVEYDPEVTVTFLTDSTLEDRQAIEAWMEDMYNTDYAMKYPYADNGYLGTVILRQLDRSDMPIYEVKLIDAFPEALTGFSFDSSSSAIQTFDVTFGYRTWKSSFENEPANSILGALFKKAGKKIKGKVRKKTEDFFFD
tara:strand:- start:15 stop:623 length:609 start_codon:yes stop_codon:yes gene_type:complete